MKKKKTLRVCLYVKYPRLCGCFIILYYVDIVLVCTVLYMCCVMNTSQPHTFIFILFGTIYAHMVHTARSAIPYNR